MGFEKVNYKEKLRRLLDILDDVHDMRLLRYIYTFAREVLIREGKDIPPEE